MAVLIACQPIPNVQRTLHHDPIRLGITTWAGYGPLFLAQEQGYFLAEGIEVVFVMLESPNDRFEQLADGKVDGLATTVNNFAFHWTEEKEMTAVMALDDSRGSIGIVAEPNIESVSEP